MHLVVVGILEPRSDAFTQLSRQCLAGPKHAQAGKQPKGLVGSAYKTASRSPHFLFVFLARLRVNPVLLLLDFKLLRPGKEFVHSLTFCPGISCKSWVVYGITLI